MSKLVNKDGSINIIEFRTKSGAWRIIGTESTGKGLENCIDEMRNADTGEYVKRTRLQLKELEDKGYIKIISYLCKETNNKLGEVCLVHIAYYIL